MTTTNDMGVFGLRPMTVKATVALAVTYANATLGIKPVRVENDKVTALELNLSELVPLADALLKMADELGVAR